MFAPSGISVRSNRCPTTGACDRHQVVVDQLGAGYLVVKSRQRITKDGGRSILIVDGPAGTSSTVFGTATDERGEDELPSGFTQSPMTTPPSSSEDSPASSATRSDNDYPKECADSSGATSSSASPWEKYRPLIDFIQRKHDEGVHQVLVRIIRNRFGYKDDFVATLEEAITLGLLECGTSHWLSDDERVTVSSRARAIMEQKLVSLARENSRFIPLVRYLQGQAASGFHEINVATIERRLGEDIVAVIGDAEAAGFVQIVPKSVKPKIMLPTDTHFVFA